MRLPEPLDLIHESSCNPFSLDVELPAKGSISFEDLLKTPATPVFSIPSFEIGEPSSNENEEGHHYGGSGNSPEGPMLPGGYDAEREFNTLEASRSSALSPTMHELAAPSGTRNVQKIGMYASPAGWEDNIPEVPDANPGKPDTFLELDNPVKTDFASQCAAFGSSDQKTEFSPVSSLGPPFGDISLHYGRYSPQSLESDMPFTSDDRCKQGVNKKPPSQDQLEAVKRLKEAFKKIRRTFFEKRCINSSSFRQNPLVAAKTARECKQCKLVFSNAGRYAFHHEQPGSESESDGYAREYCSVDTCPHANIGFETRQSLSNHIAPTHAIKRTRCAYCNRGFAQDDMLRRHLLSGGCLRVRKRAAPQSEMESEMDLLAEEFIGPI